VLGLESEAKEVRVVFVLLTDGFAKACLSQTWGDYSTNAIDCGYDYLPPAWLRLRINKIIM